MICFAALCTEAASSLFFFSRVYQNEVEMRMRIKLWDSKKFQRLRYSLTNAQGKEKHRPCSVII